MRTAIAVLTAAILAMSAWNGTRADEGDTSGKKFPPYPDVWGRELPVPEGRLNGISGYPNRNGDILFELTTDNEDPTDSEKSIYRFFVMPFFDGGLLEIDNDKATKIMKEWRESLDEYKREKKIGVFHFIHPNGFAVGHRGRSIGKFPCPISWDPDALVTVKHPLKAAEEMDSDDFFHGEIDREKFLFHLPDRPVKGIYLKDTGCFKSDPGCYVSYDKYIQYYYFVRFFPLEDGSFLTYDSGFPYVIRFRPDLTSPFLDGHPRLFLVDADTLDTVLADACVKNPPPYHRRKQLIFEDVIHDYLLKLEEENEK